MKQIKILGVLAIALTLGLAACSGGGNTSGGESGGKTSSTSQHKHEAASDAQWQFNDNQHWKDCKDNDGGKVETASHKWVADESKQSVAATCQAEGKAFEKCSVCGKTRERTLAKTDHTFEQVDGADKVVWTKEADCTNGGEGEKECTVCHEKVPVTSEALGHVYEQVDGADKVVWTKEADCTHGGEGQKECTRCHEKADVKVDALGHDIKLVGSETVPEAGKAAVRLYSCTRCDVSYLGFKADEVSEASKSHLVFETNSDGEIGARFWGRPIGNAMELGDDGSASGADAVKIFDKTVEGDFFEYVFDLTKEQAAELQNCRLYCDAKPAAYLGGQDFWACDPTAEEWTPGYYIDDDPAHVGEDGNGLPIADYRYILYVDGEVKAFDPEIKAPVSGRGGSEPRAEYVMPYTFKLHEGTNRISLRMAGGYRSLFYNFTFRPVEEQGEGGGDVEPTVNVIKEWTIDEIIAARSDASWGSTKDFGNDIKGFKFNVVGGFDLTYTPASAQNLTFQLNIAVKQSNNAVTGFWKQDSTEKTSVKLNDTAVAAGAEPDFSGSVASSLNDNGTISLPMWTDVFSDNFAASANKISVYYLAGGYSYYICGARLIAK